jgi:hypothetical protein
MMDENESVIYYFHPIFGPWPAVANEESEIAELAQTHSSFHAFFGPPGHAFYSKPDLSEAVDI